MVIPPGKQKAGEPETDAYATLCYEATWEEGAARMAEARRALRALLARAPRTGRAAVPASLALDAELAVSELVTNAARHAPGPCGLILRLSGDELTITVWDTSGDAPVVREADPTRVGGHGMRMVHTISDRVVVSPHGGGKRIVAHFPLPSERGVDGPGGTVLPASARAEHDRLHDRSAELDEARS
ncbi:MULTISPECIES: ATP-binding protein [unclassified Streptomyces]|uniref:ATP-binding protein n=1 Tax=unclassified Streptomyces TaxID=2593676 RepID=UPI0007C819C8|nr:MULTISPECIES: ATP-binding protein [unclassified Streptomyces]